MQYGIHLIYSVALATASGYYYFRVETENQCYALKDNSNPKGELIDVSALFNRALIMVFAYHIIDSFRNLLALLYVVSFLKFDIIEIIYDFLALNSLLGVATLIIIHERFSE